MTRRSSTQTKNSWRTQYQQVDNASLFHNKVRDIFATDSYFKYMKCYQEVNVAALVPGYPHRSHHFDWYIDELNTIIELHGAQHYKVVNYGNIGYDEAQRDHIRIKDRDNTKQLAAEQAGYTFVEVSYKDYKHLDAKRLKHIIFYGNEDE